MRMRSLALGILLTGCSVAVFSGCSGKPENSPAIRKKFAEVDKMQQSVDQMTAEVALLTDQVRRLSDENSELRAFLPEVDGAAAVNRLAELESRVSKVESLAADRVVAATSTGSSTRTTPAPVADRSTASAGLETAPLAGSANPAPVVASQQESTPARPAGTQAAARTTTTSSDNFRQKTNPAATTSTASATASKPAAPPAPRGSYHVIQPGETVETIAKANGISVDAILKANRLPAGARLAKGQRLFIPAK